MSRLDSPSVAALAGPSPSGPESETNRDWRGAARSPGVTEKLGSMGFNDLDWRGGMRAFRGSPMEPPFSLRFRRGVGNEVLHLVGAATQSGGRVGEGRSRVYRRVVAKSKSVYLRSEALLRDGSEEKEEEEERRKGREEVASANVTGLHSDVGVQRLHRRASYTDVHARAHTLILGVRRPLPAR